MSPPLAASFVLAQQEGTRVPPHESRTLRAYYAHRDLTGQGFRAACYAPHVSLYFNTNGDVLACCQNTRYPVGNIQEQSLADIWHGPRVRTLRKALEKDNFAAGCQFCEWQISVGNFANTFTRNFDGYTVAQPTPEWPQLMEFSVSNVCNLECVMCYGMLSSAIRSHREKLPPLPKAYGEQFFADLPPFLAQLRRAKFLGGEPFLAAESFRVWDLMLAGGHRIPCHVTTNGTQYNDRVERVLANLPVDLSVSIDAVTPETFEAIRVNARLADVMANFARFHAYARASGNNLSITHCLMQQNWREFGELLLWAESQGCPVYVNVVREPPHCTLFALPSDELERVATALERQGEAIRPRLSLNRAVWDECVADLRRRVERSSESARPPFDTPLSLVLHVRVEDAPPAHERMTVEEAQRLLGAWQASDGPRSFSTDADERVIAFGPETNDLFDVKLDAAGGRSYVELVEQLRERHGPHRRVEVFKSGKYVDRLLEFCLPGNGVLSTRWIARPVFNEFGTPQGAETVAAGVVLAPDDGAPQPGAIRAELADWSGDRPCLALRCDRQGVVTAIEEAAEIAGLPAVAAVGRLVDELLPTLGPGRISEEWTRRPGFDDLVYRAEPRGGAPWLCRVTRRAEFDDQRKAIGWRWWFCAATLSADRARLSAETAREQLDDWSPDAARMTIESDAQRIIRGLQTSPGGFPGIDATAALGNTLDQLGEQLNKNLGPLDFLDWQRKFDQEDLTLQVASPTGLVVIRTIATPRFDATGRYLGWTRQAAAATGDEALRLAAESSSARGGR